MFVVPWLLLFLFFGVFCFGISYFNNDCLFWGGYIFFFLNQNSQTVAHGPVEVYKSLFSYYDGPMGCIMLSLDLVPDGKYH